MCFECATAGNAALCRARFAARIVHSRNGESQLNDASVFCAPHGSFPVSIGLEASRPRNGRVVRSFNTVAEP